MQEVYEALLFYIASPMSPYALESIVYFHVGNHQLMHNLTSFRKRNWNERS